MSETNRNDKAAPKIEQATAFTTWQNLWKSEAHKFLDESAQGMERCYSESERMMNESSRLFTAQTRAMHDASRTIMAGLRTMMG